MVARSSEMVKCGYPGCKYQNERRFLEAHTKNKHGTDSIIKEKPTLLSLYLSASKNNGSGAAQSEASPTFSKNFLTSRCNPSNNSMVVKESKEILGKDQLEMLDIQKKFDSDHASRSDTAPTDKYMVKLLTRQNEMDTIRSVEQLLDYCQGLLVYDEENEQLVCNICSSHGIFKYDLRNDVGFFSKNISNEFRKLKFKVERHFLSKLHTTNANNGQSTMHSSGRLPGISSNFDDIPALPVSGSTTPQSQASPTFSKNFLGSRCNPSDNCMVVKEAEEILGLDMQKKFIGDLTNRSDRVSTDKYAVTLLARGTTTIRSVELLLDSYQGLLVKDEETQQLACKICYPLAGGSRGIFKYDLHNGVGFVSKSISTEFSQLKFKVKRHFLSDAHAKNANNVQSTIHLIGRSPRISSNVHDTTELSGKDQLEVLDIQKKFDGDHANSSDTASIDKHKATSLTRGSGTGSIRSVEHLLDYYQGLLLYDEEKQQLVCRICSSNGIFKYDLRKDVSFVNNKISNKFGQLKFKVKRHFLSELHTTKANNGQSTIHPSGRLPGISSNFHDTTALPVSAQTINVEGFEKDSMTQDNSSFSSHKAKPAILTRLPEDLGISLEELLVLDEVKPVCYNKKTRTNQSFNLDPELLSRDYQNVLQHQVSLNEYINQTKKMTHISITQAPEHANENFIKNDEDEREFSLREQCKIILERQNNKSSAVWQESFGKTIPFEEIMFHAHQNPHISIVPIVQENFHHQATEEIQKPRRSLRDQPAFEGFDSSDVCVEVCDRTSKLKLILRSLLKELKFNLYTREFNINDIFNDDQRKPIQKPKKVIKNFQCVYCSRKFSTHSARQRHSKVHFTKANPATITQRCCFCDFQCNEPNIMQQHMSLHRSQST